MKTNLTELVFILDRSGSMSDLESDTIGGFNSMLAKQQAQPGECRISTVLFDNEYELLHDRIDIKAVSPITEAEYCVRGSTALIERQRERFGWEFIFLGANIDAVEMSGRFGIARNRAQSFHNDSQGIELNYNVLSEAVYSYRAAPVAAPLDDGWSKKIELDYRERGSNK